MSPILEKIYVYNGYKCYVVLRKLVFETYRCGYVQAHKGQSIDINSIECHGGITYSNGAPTPLPEDNNSLYIGFDCAHFGDNMEYWTLERVCAECEYIVDQITTQRESEVE